MSRLIDADALTKDVVTLAKTANSNDYAQLNYDLGYNTALLHVKNLIQNGHNIDAEPVKHGNWKFEPCSKANYMKKVTLDGYYHCKECGRRFMRIEGDGWFKRCPECGTIMDGGKTDGQ